MWAADTPYIFFQLTFVFKIFDKIGTSADEIHNLSNQVQPCVFLNIEDGEQKFAKIDETNMIALFLLLVIRYKKISKKKNS